MSLSINGRLTVSDLSKQSMIRNNIMFSLDFMSRSRMPTWTRPYGGRVHYTHATAEASYDRDFQLSSLYSSTMSSIALIDF